MIFANTGHGHVRQRPDGFRMRCGGPGLCAVCQREASGVLFSPNDPDVAALAATIQQATARAEPRIARIEFAPGHENLTQSEVAANVLKMNAAGVMYEALRKTKTCALPTEVRDLVNAALAAADGRSTQEPA
jgi:hypothetical protein